MVTAPCLHLHDPRIPGAACTIGTPRWTLTTAPPSSLATSPGQTTSGCLKQHRFVFVAVDSALHAAWAPRPAVGSTVFNLKRFLCSRHITWLRRSTEPLQALGYKGNAIPCFTSIREPIDRLVSLYYYMLDKQGLAVTRLIQDMAPEEAVATMQEEWPLMRQTPLLSQMGMHAFHIPFAVSSSLLLLWIRTASRAVVSLHAILAGSIAPTAVVAKVVLSHSAAVDNCGDR